MIQCSDCQKTAAGNCGKHLESYLGSVAYPEPERPKTVQEQIDAAVQRAIIREKGLWMEIIGAWKQGTPKDHVGCGCRKCMALGEALRKAPVYTNIPL